MAPPKSDSRTSPDNPWPMLYNKAAETFDKRALEKINKDMDVLLIFGGLFSAVIATFVNTALVDLHQDYAQISSRLLFQMATNQTIPNADPTASFQPTVTAVIVNCLWMCSLLFSLFATFEAILVKEWYIEYSIGLDPAIELTRACERHIRFTALERWSLPTIVMLLPALIHFSMLLFFAGMVFYLWPLCEYVASLVCVVFGMGIIWAIVMTILPLFTQAPFICSGTLTLRYFCHPVFQILVRVLNRCRFIFYSTPRFIMFDIVTPIRTIFYTKKLSKKSSDLLTKLQSRIPGVDIRNYDWKWDLRLQTVDTSPPTQDKALLWLIRIPMDIHDTDVIVQTLKSVPSPRFRNFACRSVILLLHISLESSFHNQAVIPERFDVAMDCVILLSRIKFHLVVESNHDADDAIGSDPFIAWATQALLKFPKLGPREILELSAAAAWLSPADEFTDESFGGIMGRGEYFQILKLYIEGHIDKTRPMEPSILVNTLHSMHAFIPRGSYNPRCPFMPLLHIFSNDLNAPWFDNDDLLQALAFYALDLVSPVKRRWARRDADVSLAYLAAELVGSLKSFGVKQPLGAAEFLFSLVYKRPNLVQDGRIPWPLRDTALICKDAPNDSILQRATMAYSAMLHIAIESKKRPKNLVRDLRYSSSFLFQIMNNQNQVTNSYAVHALSQAREILKGLDPRALSDLPVTTTSESLLPGSMAERARDNLVYSV